MMSTVEGKSVATLRREWALQIEQDILKKKSKIEKQIIREAHGYEPVSLRMLLDRKYYLVWWHEFATRYPGVVLFIVLMSCAFGVLLGLR